MHFQTGSQKIKLGAAALAVGGAALGASCAALGDISAPRIRINTQAVLASVDVVFNDVPTASRVYALGPQMLAIEVPAPEVNLGQQQPYSPQANDVVTEVGRRTRVERGGVVIGELVGADKRILYTYDKVESDRVNLAAIDLPASYLVTSQGDRNYASATLPTTVFRKTKPAAFAATAPSARNKSQENPNLSWPAKHTLYLTLPSPMQVGERYELTFPGLGLATTDFEYRPDRDRSEAVQVSQLGFRPDDPFKVGYLSTWMGNGGALDFPDTLTFQVVDEESKAAVYSGRALLVRPEQQSEDPRGQDYTLTEVHRLDFSDFSQPGSYRLCVETIGCSFSFDIADSVWEEAFFTAARGFYHQRSGIPIGPPFSNFTRQRAFHPDDGVNVYQSGASLLDVNMGLGSEPTFEKLLATKTDEIVPNAWGGYFDAGDWDRRAQHLSVPRGLLELHNLFPAHFQQVALNLPESSNRLPDIIDEALWTVDFFRRLQTAEGGIRGGIESAEHPNRGETSWQESLPVLAYAPDVWTSYSYAGVAARAAHTLKRYDAQLAVTYQESALQAMAYAEANYPQYVAAGRVGELQHYVKDERNLAALELYRLTGDAHWHDVFLATTVFANVNAEAFVYGSHEQRPAAFLYARLNNPALSGALVAADVAAEEKQKEEQPDSEKNQLEPTEKESAVLLPVDERIQTNARASFLRHADDLASLTRTTAFGWSKDHPNSPLGWANGLGAPKSVSILQAHALTGDAKYLLAGINSTQFSLGANPENMTFTTGIGDRYPQNPLIIDQRITGQAPPPGITVYGPADFSLYSDYWTLSAIADDTFPSPWEWPAVENYFDTYLYPIGAEFTVDYMLSSAYTWGYLSAR